MLERGFLGRFQETDLRRSLIGHFIFSAPVNRESSRYRYGDENNMRIVEAGINGKWRFVLFFLDLREELWIHLSEKTFNQHAWQICTF